jgi:hypothetical protein
LSVFILFMLALSAGAMSTLFWVPEEDLGRGYFQLNALIILSLLALTLVVVILHPVEPFGLHPKAGRGILAVALAMGFLYYGAVWRERWNTSHLPAALALIATTAALLLSGLSMVEARTPLPYRHALLVLSLLSSALVLGWSLITMLLGHWYLIVPKLSFRHLIVFCRVLVAVVLLRCVSVALSLAVAASVDPFVLPHPWSLLLTLSGQGMFFWFRVLWGLAIPLLLATMALHCARNRSNQSATGILYVLLVGSLIGEITALYLTLSTGVPI